jgi:hypothetical protein
MESYLLNLTQSVPIGSHSSSLSPLHTGVPQGSVLGFLLFSLDTTLLSYIFQNSAVSYHLCADDAQFYVSFFSSNSAQNLTLLPCILDSVYSWLTCNRLSVNPSKTDYLLIDTPQNCAQNLHLLLLHSVVTP